MTLCERWCISIINVYTNMYVIVVIFVFHRKNQLVVPSRTIEVSDEVGRDAGQVSHDNGTCNYLDKLPAIEPSLPSTSEEIETIENIHSDDLLPALCEERVEANESVAKVSFSLLGRRLVDIGHFLRGIMSIGVHDPFSCTVSDMEIVSEFRKGLISIIQLKCKMCGLTRNIETDAPRNDSNVNTSMVMGIMATGGGYSQLQEICAAVDMPCMAQRTYAKCHDITSTAFHDAATKLMSDAAEEEARIAREKGEVDENGIPCITVVADGSWAKRSYKTKYDSLSGVAAILGYQTKRILFIGVRNKYCSICDRQKNTSSLDIVRDHKCLKNWAQSSTAMESDAIVEGFRSSIEMHGLKYTKLIGDGDSSVHRKLVDALPYGPSQLVQKIECRNHILRNYSSRLQAICLNRKVGNVVQRNFLRQNLKRLRYAVTSALKHRKGQVELPRYRRVEELRKDIVNGPYHVFGDHSACKDRGYFCDGKSKPVEVNVVKEMQTTGIFQEIKSAMHRVSVNASSLIHDVDNNIAELYNSHIAKTIGGKRVNFALRGSYQARCEAAVVNMNSNGKLLDIVQSILSENEPGNFTAQYTARKVRGRELRSQREPHQHFAKRKSHATHAQTTDSDYGPDAACPQQSDMSDDQLHTAKVNFMQALYLEDPAKIERETRGQVSSNEWREQRRKRLYSVQCAKEDLALLAQN